VKIAGLSGLLRLVVRRRFKVLYCLLAFGIFAGVVHIQAGREAPPAGTYFQGELQLAQQVRFVADESWLDASGRRQLKQTIFDQVLRRIDSARELVLVDMFLFNDFQGPVAENTRALASELTTALIRQKQRFPSMRMVVISDPINTVYGGAENANFDALSAAGAEVVLTDLTKLRDSNAVYSFIWRWLISPFGNSPGDTLPNPFGSGRVTIRSYLRMVNFKANHRKVFISDTPQGLEALVTSANPHDGSSAHRNVAVSFGGAAVSDLLASENAVLALSGRSPVDLPADLTPLSPADDANVRLQILTERRIKEAILEQLANATAGGRADLLMFYLSDRDVIGALIDAHVRGVAVRVILDVNRDAFGREKNGIPNKPVAAELEQAGVPVRWCNTAGEQCHAKMLLTGNAESATLLSGSANFTRRNLDNFNLETDVLMVGSRTAPVLQQAQLHFDDYWNNHHGRAYTVSYDTHRDERRWLRWLYLWMEASGLSTF